jgi:hypothetical protein
MGPQIPVGVNPQKSFANRREDGCLRDRVGVEIVQLHPVEMQNRPHETTCWHSEPPLMERNETQHIPRRRGWGGPARRSQPLRLGSPERGRSKPSATRTSRSSTVMVEKGHGSRGGMTVTRSAITKRRRWRRSGQGVRFSFSGYSLRLRKPKREASSRVKNHHQSPFRIYKGSGETRSTLRPNPPRNSKLEGETPVPRTVRARTTAAPPTTRLVALTLRQGRRSGRRFTSAIMTASKKVRHIVQFCILFLFPFLSLATGTGKGDTPKGILLREGSRPRALLLIRGSKAGPSEGFDSRLRALGLRDHYWSEVRRLAPRKGSTAASGHSGSAPTTDQGFEGWPPKGLTAASVHVERGMTLGTSDTWPRLGLRS